MPRWGSSGDEIRCAAADRQHDVRFRNRRTATKRGIATRLARIRPESTPHGELMSSCDSMTIGKTDSNADGD